MCVANSARSQIAEGLARDLFPDAEIESAGSEPSRVNQLAVEVMSEIGLDITQQYSKSIDKLPSNFLVDLDFVVTLCQEEVCPALQSKAKKLHWPMLDPVIGEELTMEERLTRFRKTRDGIKSKLLTLKKYQNH